MDGNLRLSNKERAELRERFLKKAAAAFERMFGKANQDQLVTFTQREDLACLLAEDMAASLLEQHAAKDTQARPTAEAACCRQCQKPGQRITKRNEKLEERPLTTRAGPITLRREKWWCSKCRIVFFSAGPQAGLGDGGLQSTRPGESGAAGEQGGVVRGRQ
jgi:hypothetical protein